MAAAAAAAKECTCAPLTYEVVGLADVVVPHGHLQGLLGEVGVFDVVGELLQGRIRGGWVTSAASERWGTLTTPGNKALSSPRGGGRKDDSSRYRWLCVGCVNPSQKVLGSMPNPPVGRPMLR